MEDIRRLIAQTERERQAVQDRLTHLDSSLRALKAYEANLIGSKTQTAPADPS